MDLYEMPELEISDIFSFYPSQNMDMKEQSLWPPECKELLPCYIFIT